MKSERWLLNTVIVFSILLIGITYQTAFSQQPPLKNILNQVDSLNSKDLREKIHLHFDKPYYAVGDTIWFKGYLVNQQNMLTWNSRVMYVDLIDNSNTIKKSLKIAMNAGLGYGNFVLGADFHEGNYRVRAYTRWMRNFDDELFFDKIIPVGDVFSGNVITKLTYRNENDKVKGDIEFTDLQGKTYSGKEVSFTIINGSKTERGKGTTDEKGRLTTDLTGLMSGSIDIQLYTDDQTMINKTLRIESSKTDLQFFAEGGELINGLPARVAFKATGSDGMGTDISGYIRAGNGDKVAEFKTEHAGMGMFKFIPRSGETYTAVLSNSDQPVPLPKPADAGYVLRVNTLTDSVQIIVMASKELIKGNEMTLVIRSNEGIYGTSAFALNKQIFSLSIPRKELPTGIVRVTLFSQLNVPVAERIFFSDNADSLRIKETFTKGSTVVADKVDLNLEITDSEGGPSRGSFSIAVVNEDKVPYDELKEKSILSDLLLTSEIRGYIENPNYYFANTDVRKQYFLDLLLLTQGWRKFAWKEVTGNKEQELKYAAEQDLAITGHLLSYLNAPLSGGNVDLVVPGKNGFTKTSRTDSKGRFSFSELNVEGETPVLFKYVNQNGRPAGKIKIDSTSVPEIRKNVNWQDGQQNINSSMIPYLSNSFDYLDYLRKAGLLANTTILNEVEITTKPISIPESANLNGPGKADYILTEDKLSIYPNLATALASKVPGLIAGGGSLYLERYKYSSFSGPKPMKVFVDGVEGNADEINMIDIEAIEILVSLSKLAVYGSTASGGALIITTKRGKSRPLDPADNGILNYKFAGYAAERVFYSPVYDINPDLTGKDLRSTIYWNPNLMTDENGKADLSFFSAQEPGTYRFTVEGIDINGKLGRKVFRRKVTGR